MGHSSRRSFPRLLAIVLAGSAISTSSDPSWADKVAEIHRQLLNQQNELRQISQDVRLSQQANHPKHARNSANRRLIEAEVQFGLGNWDDSALILYDFVKSYPRHPDYARALYYLAESLFQKGDYYTAQTYFSRLVSEIGASSKFFTQSLERLVELSLKLQDTSLTDSYLRALEGLPANQRPESGIYVRGKYAYATGHFDHAIALFRKVLRNSKYSFQASFYIGTAQVSKKDLAGALTTYTALSQRKPKNNHDRRIHELANMALGRLHYELDQPSKAIDRYLEVNRKSDLFDDVLFEVAWVYVKNREFTKALRSIELLQLTNPISSRMPEVHILEGNLRLRKAQSIGQTYTGNSAEEYYKAKTIFQRTRDAFTKLQKTLQGFIAQKSNNPDQFLPQVASHNPPPPGGKITPRQIVTSWLSREPTVQQLITINSNLAQIENDIAQAEKYTLRIDLMIHSKARINFFPALAKQRTRIVELHDTLDKYRAQLLTLLASPLRTVLGQRALTPFTHKQTRLRNEFKKLDQQGQISRQRLKSTHERYIQIDQEAARLRVVIEGLQAEITGLERYLASLSSKQFPADITTINAELHKTQQEVTLLNQELKRLVHQAQTVQDLADNIDQFMQREHHLRQKLSTSLTHETQTLRSLVQQTRGATRRQARQILRVLDMAENLVKKSTAIKRHIKEAVDSALAKIKTSIERERASLAAYKKEFVNYKNELQTLGSEILLSTFRDIARKFHNIILRSEVGLIDVAWSNKETNETIRRRLTFEQARQRKILHTEFAAVIDEIQRRQEKKSQPATDGANHP